MINKLPTLRTENIVTQKTGAEILLYDIQTNQAYALNETATLVYLACGDNLMLEELKKRTNLTDETIYLSLIQMNDAGFLAEKIDLKGEFGEMTRRDIIKLAALGSVVALPLISPLFIPKAIHAASNFATGCGGTGGSPCPRIDCDICCDDGLYDIIIVSRCPACRCL